MGIGGSATNDGGAAAIEDALAKGPENIEKTSENIIRLINMSGK